jgi:TonB-linked SusC/RagA family outer membrane protein
MKKNYTFFRDIVMPGLIKFLKIMKLTLLILLISTLSVLAGKSYSQTKTLKLSMERTTVKEVLSKIEEQSEFYFMYSEKVIDIEREVSVNFENQTIEKVLNNLFTGTNVDYTIKDRIIVLTTPEVLGIGSKSEFQQKSITGNVTDVKGQPLPGVTVVVKGSLIGTVTNTDGNFSLTNVPDDATLVFSFVGMHSEEIVVGNQSIINVSMKEESIGIEEVVAVGYGTMQKKDITGSVSQVKSEELRKSNATNISEALQGKIAANVVQSWSPGSVSTIEIRGISSITGSNEPLWVVDGVPMQSSNIILNPADIETVDVLKDASATAIYGARGSNGVIIVTTKSFDYKHVGVKVNYDGWVGYEQVAKSSKPSLFNAVEYSDYKRLSAKNGGRPFEDTYLFDSFELASMEMGRSTDWYDVTWGGSAISTNHNVSLNASTPVVGTYASFGYLKENSVVESADFTRYNVKLNNTFNLSKKVKLNTSFLIDHSIRNGFFNTFSAFYLSPNGYPYDENGEIKLYGNPNEVLHTNPLAEIQNNENELKRYGLIGNTSLEWEIIDGLKYKFFVGADYSTNRQGNYTGSETMSRSGAPFVSRYGNSMVLSTIMDNVLSYKKTFNDHRIDALAAFNTETYNYENVFLEGTDMDYDGLWYNLGAASTIINKGTALSEWGIMSYMGRFNYGFKEKYLVTLTYRYDGSSRLSEGNKWKGFPSAAVAWRLVEEPFLKNVDFVDNLKIRFSWGNTGNTNVDPYETLGLLGKTFYDWDNSPAIGYAPSVIPNPDLTWETTEEFNLGLDFGFFENRIYGNVDLYNRVTNDLMLSRNLPITSGFSNITQNIGSVKNSGVELVFGGEILKSNDFSWRMSLTFAKNKNEILDLYGDKKDDVGSKWFIGQPIRVEHKLDYTGIWQTGEETEATIYKAKPGYIKYRDLNPEISNPSISLADDRIVIPLDPDWVGGLNSTLAYKGFNLDFSLFTRQGVTGYSQIHDTQDEATGRYNQIKVDYWTADNPSNIAPMPDASGNSSKEIRNSDYFMKDLSFVRLSNVNLGYQFHSNVTEFLGVESFKAYVNWKNPFIWTNYEGMDPENGTNTRNHPSLTSLQFGLNINF